MVNNERIRKDSYCKAYILYFMYNRIVVGDVSFVDIRNCGGIPEYLHFPTLA